MSENALALPVEQQGALEVRKQVNAIQYLMKDVLQEGTHYGIIKGCGTKPTLLQAGAEKIAYMFHFVPTYTVEREDFEGGHRSYDVTCTLTNRDTGQVMGYGVGECSTLESKYRYRWVGYNENRHKEENPDIADVWNTVIKMAKKRAFVDAVKSTTAASDIFTQDIEDMPNLANALAPQMQPQQRVTATVEPVPVAAQVEPVAQPQPAQEPAQPQQQQPQQQADFEPLRNLFQPYCAARQIIASDAMDEIAQAVGAQSFKLMTQQQVNLAAQIMETTINSVSQAPTNGGWKSA